jgi:threonine dehydrogenase-like Zn-dependent dehydrogenase
VNVDETDIVTAVKDITGSAMADLVIDCASGGPASVVTAIYAARKAGRVILGGRKNRSVPEFNSDVLITRFLTLRGMRGHSYQSVELALGIIASNRCALDEMCTHVFALKDVDQALHTVGGEGLPGAIHCAVDPWR